MLDQQSALDTRNFGYFGYQLRRPRSAHDVLCLKQARHGRHDAFPHLHVLVIVQWGCAFRQALSLGRGRALSRVSLRATRAGLWRIHMGRLSQQPGGLQALHILRPEIVGGFALACCSLLNGAGRVWTASTTSNAPRLAAEIRQRDGCCKTADDQVMLWELEKSKRP